MNKMTKRMMAVSIVLLIFNNTPSMAQFIANTECHPTVEKSICGITSFDREKFINIGGSCNEAAKYTTPEQADYLFKKLNIKFGRGLGMVKGEYKYSKTLIENKNRPGYADIDYLKRKLNNDDSNLTYYKKILGKNEGMAIHDAHDAYPDFMKKYNLVNKDSSKGDFPINSDAAGEIVANILKYKFTDFTRPQFYEPVNEPDWRYWKDQRFIDFHTSIKAHVNALGLNVKVGGPCMSVSNFYTNEFKNVSHFTNFIDATNNSLDFYSFHTYDYYNWDDNKKEWMGEINSGAPLECVFDALASYTYNKYGKTLHYVATEHGGYISGKNQDDKAKNSELNYFSDKYFPGNGFKHELQKRSLVNFLMVSSAISNTFVFMNNPHIVNKAVPFILIDTSGWDPYYYSSLLVRDNFDKNSKETTICPLIYFYEFFKGVEGNIVDSWCDSGDVQHIAYRNKDNLILLYHNVSNKSGEVRINSNDIPKNISGAIIRRVGRDNDSRIPYLKEAKISDISSFKIAPQESVAIFLPSKKIKSIKEKLNETAHYALEQDLSFKGSQNFQINLDNALKVKEAFLRVGINRSNGKEDGFKIKFNNVELETKIETSAERYNGKKGYTTMKVIHLPKGVVKDTNNVEVCFTDGEKGGVGAVVLRTLSK